MKSIVCLTLRSISRTGRTAFWQRTGLSYNLDMIVRLPEDSCHEPDTLRRDRPRLVRRTPRRHPQATPSGRTDGTLHAAARAARRGRPEVRRLEDIHRIPCAPG